MKFFHRFFIIIFLIGLSSFHHASSMGLARFARNVLSQVKHIQPASLAYLYGMHTYERRLDDGTVQQAHLGSDVHIEVPEETQQVQDMIAYINEHPKKSCLAITEDMKGPSDHQQVNPERYARRNIFLYRFPAVCAAQDIPHVNIEFRDITQSRSCKYPPNNATMADVVSHFESYAHKFKHNALAKNILTEHDFEHLNTLRKELEPHMDKTVQVICDGGGYQPSWPRTIWRWATKPNSEIRAQQSIERSMHKLLEDCALYHVATTQASNIYLNMGGSHIERKQDAVHSPDGVGKRLMQQGWRHVHTSGVTSEELFKQSFSCDKETPMNVARHFAALPVRGSTLPVPTRAQYVRMTLPLFFGE